MFKKLLIFAVGTFVVSKLFSNNKKWYNFSWAGDLHQVKKAPDQKDRFFIYDGYGKPFVDEITMTSNLGLLSRLIYAEAEEEPFWVKTGIGEVVMNRKNCKTPNSKTYCWDLPFAKYNTIYDVIFNTGFYGIKRSAFYPKTYYGNNKILKNAFIDSVSAAIKVYLQHSNTLDNALFFSLGRPFPECNQIIEVKLKNTSKAKTRFFRFKTNCL